MIRITCRDKPLFCPPRRELRFTSRSEVRALKIARQVRAGQTVDGVCCGTEWDVYVEWVEHGEHRYAKILHDGSIQEYLPFGEAALRDIDACLPSAGPSESGSGQSPASDDSQPQRGYFHG